MNESNPGKLTGTVRAWRERAESMMRLPTTSAGTREMRVNAGQLLALIAEFETLHHIAPNADVAGPAAVEHHSA